VSPSACCASGSRRPRPAWSTRWTRPTTTRRCCCCTAD